MEGVFECVSGICRRMEWVCAEYFADWIVLLGIRIHSNWISGSAVSVIFTMFMKLTIAASNFYLTRASAVGPVKFVNSQLQSHPSRVGVISIEKGKKWKTNDECSRDSTSYSEFFYEKIEEMENAIISESGTTMFSVYITDRVDEFWVVYYFYWLTDWLKLWMWIAVSSVAAY